MILRQSAFSPDDIVDTRVPCWPGARPPFVRREFSRPLNRRMDAFGNVLAPEHADVLLGGVALVLHVVMELDAAHAAGAAL